MSPFLNPHKKKVIFFDMNNTLVDRRKCFDSAFLAVLEEFTARWNTQDFGWSVQDALQSYKLEWSRNRKSQTKPIDSGEKLRHICLQKALDPYALPVTPAFSKTFFTSVEEAEERYITLFPGVEETLQSLASKYNLAIISNGSRKRLENNLRKLQLTKWIPEDRIFTSYVDGPRKPHPRLFEVAMKMTNCKPNQGVMVGNSWKNDIIGATRCGLDAVWINPGHMRKMSQRKIGRQHVVIIRSFRHLTSIF